MNSENYPLDFRIAKTAQEESAVFELRLNIFKSEWIKNNGREFTDKDPYDSFCDHLIVCDKSRDDLIVGTYRILRRDVARQNIGFYAETEFNLSGIYDINDEIAEIGRSCVHPEYRNGTAIRQLWYGLMQYMKDFNLKYLCGSGSIEGKESATLNVLWHYLRQQNALINEQKIGFSVQPREENKISDWAEIIKQRQSVNKEEKKNSRKLIPPLIKGYTRAKAKFFPTPAYDPIFNTTDFFITFDVAEVEQRYGKRFLVNEES